MPQQDFTLRAIALLETKGFVKGTKEMDAAVRQLDRTLSRNKKNSGASNQAIIELGRGFADFKAGGGLQDASRGFIALANNLERFAETASFTYKQSGSLGGVLRSLGKSILGPAGVVFAITALINYGPELFKLLRNWATGTEGVTREQEKLNEALDKGTLSVEQYLTKLQQQGRERIRQLDEEIKLTEKKIEGTALSLASEEHNRQVLQQLRMERERLIEQDNLYIEGMENQAQATLEAAEAARKYKNRLAELRDQRDITEFASEEGLLPSNEPLDQFGTNLVDTFNIQGDPFGLADLPEVIEDDIDALEDLESALRMVGSAMAGLSEEEAIALAEKIQLNKDKFEDFAGALIRSFDAAAGASGNFFQNLGKGLLSAIGTFLIAEGTAAVLSGSTKIASGFLGGWGLTQVQAGYAEIAGGVALKAGASAIGRGGGGAGSSGSRSTPTAASSRNLTRTQGDAGSGRLVAEVKGEDLRFVLQQAQERYNGLN